MLDMAPQPLEIPQNGLGKELAGVSLPSRGEDGCYSSLRSSNAPRSTPLPIRISRLPE
jgi:hypothetical protein